MQKVSELVSKSIGDTLTNMRTWKNVMYNVLENGLVGDGTTDDTAALQTLINTAIAAGRRTIFFPHTATGGEYYVTSLTNADQVDFIGDNCSFVGGYAGTIQNMGAIAELSADFTQYVDDNPYVLQSDDDFQLILDSGKRYIALNPSKEYNFNGIVVPSGTKIYGNGATVTSIDTSNPIFLISDTNGLSTTDVLINDVTFKSSVVSPNNMASIGTDCGIQLYKSAKIKITDCRFENFLGAGIHCFSYPSSPAIDKMLTQNMITNCSFNQCYFGFINWFDSEYGICSENNFAYCRCAIWSQSGNWSFVGNIAVQCRAAFVSSSALNTVVFALGTNLQHGEVSSNIFNHCRADQTTAWATSNYLIGGSDYQGCYFDGTDTCTPPLFTGNTLYYTDLAYRSSNVSGMPYWYITGCVFSNMTVSSDVTARMGLVACSEQASVTKTNVVSLTTPA